MRSGSSGTRPRRRARAPAGQWIAEILSADRRANGDIRWRVQFRIDRQRVHRVIGLASEGVDRQACEAFIEKARTAAREHRLSLPRGRKVAMTLATAAPLYLARLEEGDGRNIARKRTHLHSHLIPYFGAQPLASLSEFTVGKYRKERQRADAATGTINRELATLNHVLGRAVDWKWLPAKPCRIRMAAEERPAIRVLDEAEVQALLQAALADSDPDVFLFIAFGLSSAMRHSEILGVRFEHVDFARLRLFIPKAKAGAREQPITRGLADLLRREQQMTADPRGWVFPNRRPELSPAGDLGHRTRIGRGFARVVAAAGLDPRSIRPHSLRHSAITNLVKSGADLPTIQKISGHRTLAMVLRYTNIHGGHIDAAISALDGILPTPDVPQTSHDPKAGSFGPIEDAGEVIDMASKKR